MDLAHLLYSAAQRLSGGSTTPRLDAELIIGHVLGWSRTRVLVERDHVPEPAQLAAIEELIARRATGEPVAYLVGTKAFYNLEFFVDRRVLVPRPETELLVEHALGLARSRSGPLTIADIGTGSGAIAIALATYLPQAHIYAVDLSADALAVAARNVQQHRLTERITLLHGNLLAPLPGPVDLLVSNPPYTIMAEVQPNVLQHEPWLALEGGPDGTAIYRRLLMQAPQYVHPGGAILFEIGAWQGEAVSELIRAAFPEAIVRVERDLAGLDRVVIAEV
jgi:release factor glutamine methyltransferase